MEASSSLTASEITDSAREAVTLLARAADLGGSLAIGDVQEELGLGYSDARAVMGQLVEKGLASEEEPGVWSPAEEADVAEPRVAVEVGDGEEPLARDDGAAARALETMMPLPTVKLPRAAVETMDDAALGQLVKSSLPAEGQFFLMEIS